MPKVSILVFSELETSHGDLARVVNALQIAREFKEAGDEIKLLFDGGGVAAVAAMVQPAHKLHKTYTLVADTVAGACAYCAKAFGVKEELEAAGVTLLGDYKQHPSIRSLMVDGFTVLTI